MTPRAVRERKRRNRAVQAVALALSVSLHGLLLLSSITLEPPRHAGQRRAPIPAPLDHAPQLVTLVSLPEDQPRSRIAPITPTALRLPDLDLRDSEIRVLDVAPDLPTEAPIPTLRPVLSHRSLWLPGDSGSDLIRLGLGGDPGLTERASSGGPEDAWAFASWTTSDASGQVWGAVPGALVLGGITIPLCGGRFDASSCGFGVGPGRRELYRAALELQAGLAQQRLWDQQAERSRAIRSRLGARRDSIH